MGILRTDKISGLETPTPVTGSVEFDGNGDWISVAESEDFNFGTGDFTVEFWIYWDGFNTGGTRGVQLTSAVTNGIWIGQVNTTDYVLRSYGNANHLTVSLPPLNEWHHIAVTRKDSTARFFVNGKLGASGSVTHNFVKHAITIGSDESSGHTNGYISNVRMLKGTGLYTSDFTPPTHALEVIGDTVLLCCNNPDSAGAEATGKTITVNGDAAASTVSPGLTRDFTGGTEFRGVTTFDTQGYFVPPSGTTEQRDASGGRGLIRMGPGMSYITISSLGNSKDFGDNTVDALNTSACASSTRGLFAQGYKHPLYYKTIDYVTIASTGDAKDFGDITTSASFVYGMGGCASSTRGLFAGGFTAPSPNAAAGLKQINYVTIASLGDSQDFGDLTGNGVRYPAATSSLTRGIFGGGRDSADSPVYNQNVIHYVTIATLGNANNFGDLTDSLYSMAATGSATRGIFAGGYNPAGNSINLMDYITISSTGNAQDFGDLYLTRGGSGASSNATRATFAGGSNPSAQNVIDYVTIQSTGNALDFGDLLTTMYAGCGCSNSHGGLS